MSLRVDITRALPRFTLTARFDVGETPLALVGPNGAGKTTLLLTILGEQSPDAGSMRLFDEPLFDAAAGVDVRPESRRIAYLPQDYGLFPHLTCAQNVAFGLRGESARAKEWLAQLEVAHLAERRPAGLSGGERQRVALARALASRPRALLLDEPLAALDVTTRASVRRFLRDWLRATKLPAIVVTHDPNDALELAERIAVLEAGRLVQSGTMQELASAPATPFVSAFTAAARPPSG